MNTQVTPVPTRTARPVPMSSVQGTLALDLGVPLPEQPEVRPPELRMVRGERRELEAFARGFARAVVEVLGGDRGPSQLVRWTSEQVYADLQERTQLLNRTTPGDRRRRRLRSQVRSVHVFCPCPGAAEVSVHVRQGQRSRAIAFRLDLRERRWCCTHLQLG